MNSPNVFIVGFQKCASSTLFDILSKHPDISGSSPKETFYLSDNTFDIYNFKKSIDNRQASWDMFLDKNNKVIMESSVCNFYQENALRYIKDQKDAKVIFILRDPVQRFISVYKYLYGNINGIPVGMSLDEFFNKCLIHFSSRHLLRFAIDHGKYHGYIQLWQKELGKKRIHILGMKELIQSPGDALTALLSFMELPHQNLGNIPHKNMSKSYISPTLHHKLVNLFGGTIFATHFTKSLYSKLAMKNSNTLNLQFGSEDSLRQMYKEEYKHYSYLF